MTQLFANLVGIQARKIEALRNPLRRESGRKKQSAHGAFFIGTCATVLSHLRMCQAAFLIWRKILRCLLSLAFGISDLDVIKALNDAETLNDKVTA